MKRKNNYSITANIKSFITNTNKLTLTPKNGIVGYNHLMKAGTSNKTINSETAYYLMLSDLNSICSALNEYLEVELSENKLCALVSYFYSNHTIPSSFALVEINKGNLQLAGELLFLNNSSKEIRASRDSNDGNFKLGIKSLFLGNVPKEMRALRAQEYILWNDDKLEILNLKPCEFMFL